MPSKPATPCTRCGRKAVKGGRCEDHMKQADHLRGTAHQRGYTTLGHQAFRTAVLTRDPWCKCGKHRASIADHYPKSRRQLVADGLNPDDPAYGRGLCQRCHDQHTASTQGIAIQRRNR